MNNNKSLEVAKKIDELGRIVIPKKCRESLDILDDNKVLVSYEEDKIVIKKYKEPDSYFRLNIKSFTDNWLKTYKNDIIIITDLLDIKEVITDKEMKKPILLNDDIMDLINKNDFFYDSYTNKEIIVGEEKNNGYIITLNLNGKRIGSVIIIHN